MPALALPRGTPVSLAAARTRGERALALLTLNDATIHRLTCTPTINQALGPFRRRFESGATAFDLVAFIHGFGVVGPSRADWDGLFKASHGLLAEDVALCVAFAVTGGACVCIDGKWGWEMRPQWRVLLKDVLLGEGDTPGILDRVCDLFDEWVVSGEEVQNMVRAAAEAEAERWWLERIDEGLYAWRGGDEGDNLQVREVALGDGMRLCAGRIALSETRGVLESAVRRVSIDGMSMAVRRLRGGAEDMVEMARQTAEGVLVCRVFECLGLPVPGV